MISHEVEFEEESYVLSPVVSSDMAHVRLDKFLASSFPDFSRNMFIHLIEENHVKNHVSGVWANHPDMKVEAGDIFEIYFPAPTSTDAKPEDMPLDIVYEDEDVVVVSSDGCDVTVEAGSVNDFKRSNNSECYTFSSLVRDDENGGLEPDGDKIDDIANSWLFLD